MIFLDSVYRLVVIVYTQCLSADSFFLWRLPLPFAEKGSWKWFIFWSSLDECRLIMSTVNGGRWYFLPCFTRDKTFFAFFCHT